jgi:2-dehydropantoate 2-reductase
LEKGYTIHDARRKSDADPATQPQPFNFKPHAVYSSTSEAIKGIPQNDADASSPVVYDHIMIFTKTTVDPIPLLKPLLESGSLRKDGGSISLWQNGIGIEQRVKDAFPGVPLISVVMYVGISQVEMGVINATPVQKAVMGLYPTSSSTSASLSEDTKTLESFASVLRSSNLTTIVVPDIQVVRWHKSLWNATFGIVGLAAGCVDSQTIMEDPESLALVRQLMQEVADAAEKVLGQALPFKDFGTFDDLMDITRKLGPYKASVLLDWERGAELELEFLYGNLIRKAKAKGGEVPRLESLYTLLNLMVKTRRM